METYFHEALHYTGANNLSAADHNKVERIKYDYSNPCQKNMFDDRIVFISAVCGFQTVVDGYFIGKRFVKCDEKYEKEGADPWTKLGCMRTLMHIDEGILIPLIAPDPHYAGGPWKEEEARRLCQAIKRNVFKGQDHPLYIRVRNKIYATEDTILKYDQTMMEQKRIPAYYLAALSASEREQFAQDTTFEHIDYCKAEPDGSINIENQGPECPLAYTDISRKLVQFNNSEAALRKDSMAIERAIEDYIYNESPPERVDEDIELDIENLYQQYCSETQSFKPAFCDNIKEILMGLLNAVRQIK